MSVSIFFVYFYKKYWSIHFDIFLCTRTYPPPPSTLKKPYTSSAIGTHNLHLYLLGILFAKMFSFCYFVLDCKNGETFPHEKDCRKYYVCDHGMNVTMQCPLGTAWHKDNVTCVYTEDVGCKFHIPKAKSGSHIFCTLLPKFNFGICLI